MKNAECAKRLKFLGVLYTWGMDAVIALPGWDAQLALRERLMTRSHAMTQTWSELLFLHWKYDPEVVQATLPKGLKVDTFDGAAWMGIVPFYMNKVRPRFLPSVPWVSFFLELNVRTYVRDEQGRPGVWFYSLDCNQPLAVWTARTFFHLPYEHARMGALKGEDGTVRYDCRRSGAESASRYEYRIDALSSTAEPGTLEFFLVERYLLFANSPRGIRSGRVHHDPYPVANAGLDVWDAMPLVQAGFSDPGREPDHVCGSRGVDVRIYGLE
ncbi:DUF2071 domain-containing protein [Phragmitibacter flavus]|uniref:DUF2071 domain-containing protein n=1 Tax=Phragmitibacter flavus TaxID=2576071 RepID=A0A5R8K8J5_9BACT|nr:DUF2071 domain-containing protein [Phragmitibacter flavus]TLD68657.1 DUF2071 domain-containing protein [Phragmitibacter flavus]